MSEAFQDRRKHVRIYRNFILNFHQKNKADVKYDISQVNNISKGGINFVATQPLDEGVLIGVDLQTPFIAESVYLEGVVLQCKAKIPNLIYEIRLQFNQLSEQAETILNKIERYSAL
jgi:hypothetical protein